MCDISGHDTHWAPSVAKGCEMISSSSAQPSGSSLGAAPEQRRQHCVAATSTTGVSTYTHTHRERERETLLLHTPLPPPLHPTHPCAPPSRTSTSECADLGRDIALCTPTDTSQRRIIPKEGT
mmetsp:Transcript_60606/g.100228  ORF Transcript_60606/g.100228 Transcript_60606/m.100228 type:complete len:123 (+) Transcript_60606:143-511(+)